MDWKTHNQEIMSCRKCPRLVAWREQVAREKKAAYRDWEYWGKPVPGFGDEKGRVMVVGLAPGAHGSNRTGRMFTGDASGNFLYPALYRAGFCNRPLAVSADDGLELKELYITAIVRCVPPKNKPSQEEIENCRPFLLQEIALLPNLAGFVALGRVAFEQMLKIYQQYYFYRFPQKPLFAHNTFYEFPNLPWLLASYHPSRQNTQTGRLSEAMFAAVWEKVALKVKR